MFLLPQGDVLLEHVDLVQQQRLALLAFLQRLVWGNVACRYLLLYLRLASSPRF